MDSFKRYLDQVKAEAGLKKKTEGYVKAALASGTQNKENKIHLRRGQGIRRKVWIAVASIAVCMVISGGGYAYYKTPVNYVSLDINPSVELGVNVFDTVVTVEPVNEDGQDLLEAKDVIGLPIEKAIEDLVEEAADQDYIADNGTTVIAVTAESDDERVALKLQEKSAQGVSLAMSNKKVIAEVYQDCSDLALRAEAKEQGVSPGKYKLIMMMQTLDPSITVEQYKEAKVSQIIREANQILVNSELTEDELTDAGVTVEKLKGIEKQIQKAEDRAERELEREQEQEAISDTDTDDEDSQKGNRVSNANKNKNQNQDNLNEEDEDGVEVENEDSDTTEDAVNDSTNDKSDKSNNGNSGSKSKGKSGK